MKTQKEYLQRARASVGPKKRRSATRARPQFALGSVFLADCPGDFRSQGSFLRLWQIDAVLSEFRRPLGEPAPALGSFFRRGGGTQRPSTEHGFIDLTSILRIQCRRRDNDLLARIS